MENYILLLHQSTTARPEMSPDEIQAIIARYKAWGQKLREAGRFVGSNKLEDGTGRVLLGAGGKVRITDGPYAETKDVVSGYFVIAAGSYEEAVEMCRDCPHLELGFGAIEIRKVHVV
jgi:hypothetical protein